MLKEIRWRGPEFEYYEKGPSWYWLTIIVAILLAAFAVWQRNFLFAVFIIIAEAVIVSWARRKPREAEFKLDYKTLVIDSTKVYPYETLAGFTVRGQELIFKKKTRFSSYLKMPILERDAERIKSFLSNFLPEIEYEESLTDHIARLLKF